MNKALTQEISERIDGQLSAALDKTHALAAYLTDRGGYIIGQRAARELPMEDNLVALIAGAFFASQQAAQLLGEEEFNSMVEKGKDSSLLVRVLDGDHLLIFIYGKETNAGLVKLFAEESVGDFNTMVQDLQRGAASQSMHTFEMDHDAPIFEIKHS